MRGNVCLSDLQLTNWVQTEKLKQEGETQQCYQMLVSLQVQFFNLLKTSLSSRIDKDILFFLYLIIESQTDRHYFSY